MSDNTQKDNPVIQGFDTYLRNRKYIHELRKRACAIMKNKVLPKYSINELREIDEFTIAHSINPSGKLSTEHDYRYAIRRFKEYLEVTGESA